MQALYNLTLSLAMTKSKNPKPLLTMPSVMVQENNSPIVGNSYLGISSGLPVIRPEPSR
jgi:hypothetical protein